YPEEMLDINDIANKLNEEGKHFVVIHLTGAHEMYLCGEPYDSMFDPEYEGEIPDYETYLEYVDIYGSEKLDAMGIFFELANGLKIEEIVKMDYNETSEEHLSDLRRRKVKDHEHVIALYDGKIRRTDDTVGKIFSLLKAGDAWDNTVLVVFSDHGEGFFEHGYYDHGLGLYDDLIHVVFFMKIPGMQPREINRLVGLIDVAPTVFDVLGIDANLTKQDGLSALKVMGDRESNRDIFSQLGTSLVSVRTEEGYLYIYCIHAETGELYKLPDDHNNIISQEPEKGAELERKILEYLGYY
ncbi:MAG: sulfatase-like hydrolase/transferase, partial [Candidatus Aenigmatarchaeota archaeon]